MTRYMCRKDRIEYDIWHRNNNLREIRFLLAADDCIYCKKPRKFQHD